MEEKELLCIMGEQYDKKYLQPLDNYYNIYNHQWSPWIDTSTFRSAQYHTKFYPQENLPFNLQEYSHFLFILKKPFPFAQTNIYKRENIAFEDTYYKIKNPQTYFNPTPLYTNKTYKIFNDIKNRSIIFIYFCHKIFEENYSEYLERKGEQTKVREYSLNILPFIDNYSGIKYNTNSGSIIKEIEINDAYKKIGELLKYNEKEITYNCTFEKKDLNDNFIPLLLNKNNEIISFIHKKENIYSIVLPVFKNEVDIINELFINTLPSIWPDCFSNISNRSWVKNGDYPLPNEVVLKQKKENILIRHKNELEVADNEMIDNENKFSFLHKILTETGDELVNNIIIFLKWLGFENIINADSLKKGGDVLEEDIQINLGEHGLLIIEVKGINRTSKDEECSQIQKIKFRKCEERGKFDVYALYIVNHQKNIPAFTRTNPPFTENQINDSKIGKYSLLTTLQLYNLYFDIEDDIITREDAINTFFNYGLLEFQPSNIMEISKPKELLKDDKVLVFDLENGISIRQGDDIFLKEKGRYKKTNIESIQINGESVDMAEGCEVGIQINTKATKHSIICIRTES